MKKWVWIIMISVTIMGLLIWTAAYFHGNSSHTSPREFVFTSDSIQQEFVSRKKELMLKEYDSLFSVFDRETVIVNNFRGWVITLLVLCITALLTTESVSPRLIKQAGIFIILMFYVLEISERYVMLNLMQELQSFESIFNIQNAHEFNNAVGNYEFRDMRDIDKNIRIQNIVSAIFDPKVIWWNVLLIFFYIFVIKNVRKK